MLQAIQNATTGLRLTVVMPAVFQKLCIIKCPTSSTCFPLKDQLDALVKQSGFKGANPKEDTFVAGHSLGATCANYVVQGYSYAFAGLMEFGGYVDMTGNGSVANFSIPVLHMAGELDGGAARPGKLSWFYRQMREYEKTHSTDVALTRKPVQVLEGLDHSDFCPGFFVTKVKDCKSEVTQEVALQRIGEGASAFLHLNTPTPATTKTAALTTMKTMLEFTSEMCDPYLKAFELEQSGSQGPWCSKAQPIIAGLSEKDLAKLTVSDGGCDLVLGDLHQFEHFHTNYTTTAEGGLSVSCGAAVEEPSNTLNTGSQVAAASIDCKMVDATRIGQQMNVTTNASVECADINRMAVALAESMISEKSRKRYQEKGRKYCFKPDAHAFGNIGPLFIQGKLTSKETAECMEVTSLGLISTISSAIYPGNHYCKLLSPALAMDWMMTDSHKPFPYNSSEAATIMV